MAEEISRVVIPKNLKFFKFVQLYIKQEPFMVFDGVAKDHGLILKETLERGNLNYEIKRDYRPNLIGKDYEGVGMGIAYKRGHHLIIDNIDNTSTSFSYDIGFNQEHFERVKPFFPNDLTIKLRSDE